MILDQFGRPVRSAPPAFGVPPDIASGILEGAKRQIAVMDALLADDRADALRVSLGVPRRPFTVRIRWGVNSCQP